MSAIERRSDIHTESILSPEEQRAVDAHEEALRKIVPHEIFIQAEEIVSQYMDQSKAQLLAFDRKLDNQQRREVSKIYNDDESKTIEELADQFDVSNMTVLRTLKDFEVERRPTGMPKGKEVRKLPTQQIADRYEEGDSLRRLGSDYDVDPSTIQGRLVKIGVIIRSKEEQLSLQSRAQEHLLPSDEILAAQFEQGMSTSELAENYGVHPSTIERKLKRAGVK